MPGALRARPFYCCFFYLFLILSILIRTRLAEWPASYNMNIEELKKLVKNSTAVLVLDNGEPSFVILKYDTYKELVLAEPVKEVKIKNGLNRDEVKPASPQGGPDAELEVLERINKDILALKEEIEKEEKMASID